MNLLVLTFDRWNWSFAEPLGNRWIRTPVLNRLAAMGTVFGQCYATSSETLTTWRTLLMGPHSPNLPNPREIAPPVCRRYERRPTNANVLSHIFRWMGDKTAPAVCEPLPDSLPQILASRGWRTRLLTDSESLAQSPGVEFETIETVRKSPFLESPSDPLSAPTSNQPSDQISDPTSKIPLDLRCAKSLEFTELFREISCFHETLETLSGTSEPFLLAAHWETLGRIWDAPYEFRAQYVGGDDPDPGDSAVVPPLPLPPDTDPDERLAIHQAYAGQISLLDTLLEPLVDWLNESESGRNTALLLMGVRGVPCNETAQTAPLANSPLGNGRGDGRRNEPQDGIRNGIRNGVQDGVQESNNDFSRRSNGRATLWGSNSGLDATLSADGTHLPVFLRLPENAAQWTRSSSLVTPEDLYTILRIATQLDISEELRETTFIPDEPFCDRFDAAHVRDRILITGADNERAFLTDHWYLRYAPDSAAQLFLRRDDPFQTNDVSSRCGEIVESLIATLSQPPTTPLPEIATLEPS